MIETDKKGVRSVRIDCKREKDRSTGGVKRQEGLEGGSGALVDVSGGVPEWRERLDVGGLRREREGSLWRGDTSHMWLVVGGGQGGLEGNRVSKCQCRKGGRGPPCGW